MHKSIGYRTIKVCLFTMGILLSQLLFSVINCSNPSSSLPRTKEEAISALVGKWYVCSRNFHLNSDTTTHLYNSSNYDLWYDIVSEIWDSDVWNTCVEYCGNYSPNCPFHDKCGFVRDNVLLLGEGWCSGEWVANWHTRDSLSLTRNTAKMTWRRF